MLRMREAKWDSLTSLHLSIYDFMQTIIPSATRGADTYRGQASLRQKKLMLVKIQFKLGRNQISSLGMSHLAKAEWKKLTMIRFCTNNVIQLAIKLESTERRSFPQPNGERHSQEFTWATIILVEMSCLWMKFTNYYSAIRQQLNGFVLVID